MQSDHYAVMGDLPEGQLADLGKTMERLLAEWTRLFPDTKGEVVLEGKVNYLEKVREDQGVGGGSPGKNYFFPEFLGYEGIAERAFKFEVTAITFRDQAQYYTPLADSCES